MQPAQQADPGLGLFTVRARSRGLLNEMGRQVPQSALVQIVEPHYPCANTVRPPLGIVTMLLIHYLQQWSALSDPAMENALQVMPALFKFVNGGF